MAQEREHHNERDDRHEGPLDAAVFEVPAGFRQVAHIETSPAADLPAAWANTWVPFKAKVERPFD